MTCSHLLSNPSNKSQLSYPLTLQFVKWSMHSLGLKNSNLCQRPSTFDSIFNFSSLIFIFIADSKHKVVLRGNKGDELFFKESITKSKTSAFSLSEVLLNFYLPRQILIDFLLLGCHSHIFLLQRFKISIDFRTWFTASPSL